jgi:hypothetical protein
MQHLGLMSHADRIGRLQFQNTSCLHDQVSSKHSNGRSVKLTRTETSISTRSPACPSAIRIDKPIPGNQTPIRYKLR